jgi:hypothetical protein
MKTCYSCGKELDIGDRVGRHEICPCCHRDLRCCFNCALYDPGASNHCREPQSEEIRDRDRSNFCDFFVFGDKEVNESNDKAGKAKEEWERLFKK